MDEKMLVRLASYHIWATRRVINRLTELPEDVLHREVQGVFPTLFHAIYHVLSANEVWLDRVRVHQGRIAELARSKPITHEPLGEKGMDDVQVGFECVHKQLLDAVNEMSESELVGYENSMGKSFTTRFDEIVLHMINHGTYHFGNITAMLRHRGLVGVSVDFIEFSRLFP